MNPKISVLGLLQADNTLFDEMSLPDGVDKTRVIDQIIEDCAELEILFPDPEYMKYAIMSWSARRLYSWTELYKTTKYDYNPIWNKDGTIIETEEGSNNTERHTTGNANSGGTNSHSVRGFNEEDLIVSEQDSATNNAQSTENMAEDAGHSITRTRTERGNIGITSTQTLISEQRNISNFDIYQIICDDFKTRFCVMIY